MRIVNTLRIVIFDFINGIWSQIPLCCVIFFCKQVLRGKFYIAKEVHEKRYPNIPYGFSMDKVNYVRCDKCHEKNRIAKINTKNGSILKFLIRPGLRTETTKIFAKMKL